MISRNLYPRIGLVEAINFLGDGLKLALSKECRLFVIIPIMINIVVLMVGGYFTVHWLLSLIDSYIVETLPSWLSGFVIGFLGFVISLCVGFIACFFFSTIATLIASPFYGLLAEKAESLIRGEISPQNDSLMGVVKDIPRILGRELRKWMFYLPRLIGCCIISIIPGLNIISPICWFLLAAWMMSIQYVDYAYDNHKISFQNMRQDLAFHRYGSFGFGGVISMLMTIPLFNLILPPAAVCAGTKFFVVAQSKKLDPMGNNPMWGNSGSPMGNNPMGGNPINQAGQPFNMPQSGSSGFDKYPRP